MKMGVEGEEKRTRLSLPEQFPRQGAEGDLGVGGRIVETRSEPPLARKEAANGAAPISIREFLWNAGASHGRNNLMKGAGDALRIKDVRD
ncbi:hypothetical protein EYF80_043294 [Liparis tanakae]|uniref:Uncharacterized protein n=1 Tax=Liparis tanakae TaxID=230148 RepID=A0A4Z2FYV1_9TELE|nr:hypothetical protein EYF80_043294 [Liparis tanakae]